MDSETSSHGSILCWTQLCLPKWRNIHWWSGDSISICQLSSTGYWSWYLQLLHWSSTHRAQVQIIWMRIQKLTKSSFSAMGEKILWPQFIRLVPQHSRWKLQMIDSWQLIMMMNCRKLKYFNCKNHKTLFFMERCQPKILCWKGSYCHGIIPIRDLLVQGHSPWQSISVLEHFAKHSFQ